jgi:hemolysin activation/secretion protein
MEMRPFAMLLVALWIIGIGRAMAQAVSPQQDPGQRLYDEQRARKRREQLDQSAAPIAVPRSGRPNTRVPLDADVAKVIEHGPTFEIDHIDLRGNTVLPQQETIKIIAPFLHHRLGVRRINLLLRRLTSAFVRRGYITTRAYLGQQNLASGTLVVTIVPGTIEAFRVNGSAHPDRGIRWAFPTHTGDTLKLADLEQGVDQINRLRRNRAELRILPGQTPGGSIVELTNRPGKRFYYNLGIDNYGSRTTGRTRLRAGVEADNVLGLEAALTLNFVGSRDSNAVLISTAIPYGYSTFSYTAFASEFQELIENVALLYGRTVGQTLGWNRVVMRSHANLASIDATLSVRRAEREVNDIMLAPQRLSVLRVGYDQVHRFATGDGPASVTFGASVSRGLTILDASEDESGMPDDIAHSQFTKLDFAAGVTLPLGRLAGTSWLYRGNLTGQWAHVGLFSSEQMFVGGAGSVRGYAEAAVAGDRGFVMRDELSWRQHQSATHFEISGRTLYLEPYLFLDFGQVQYAGQESWQRAAGVGVGIRARLRHRAGHAAGALSAGLTLGCPLLKLPDSESGNAVLMATLNWIF